MKKTIVEESLTIPQQVKIALDGRTQRWLALEIKMSEDVLSKKMANDKLTDADILLINQRLSSNIARDK